MHSDTNFVYFNMTHLNIYIVFQYNTINIQKNMKIK